MSASTQKCEYYDLDLDLLKNDIATAIMLDDNGNIKYDGLIVCISSHGIKNKIITSNEKLMDKTFIHRLVSIDNPKIREIPR